MKVISSTIYKFNTDHFEVKVDFTKNKCSFQYRHSHTSKYFKVKTKYEIIFTRIWFGSFKNIFSVDSPKFVFDEKDKYETILLQVSPFKYIHVYDMINEFESFEPILYFYNVPSKTSGIISYAECKTYSIVMFSLDSKFSYININNSYKKKYKSPLDVIDSLTKEEVKLLPDEAFIEHQRLI